MFPVPEKGILGRLNGILAKCGTYAYLAQMFDVCRYIYMPCNALSSVCACVCAYGSDLRMCARMNRVCVSIA